METARKDAEVKRHQRKSSVSSSCSSVPDLQKCTPSKKDVFDCILDEYNGTVSFFAISRRQDLFSDGCGNIGTWFKARKDSFLLRESKDGKILEVSTFCRRAQLCFRPACSTKNCQCVHVCRDYIAGFCRFGDRCRRNHSFQYDEDRKFLSKLRLNGLSENNLRKVMQLSMPQVCLDYNEGSCSRGQSCAQIHICKNMIKKMCEDETNCGLQHKDALLTPHTAAILQKYGLKIKDGNVNQLLRVLLVCVDKPAGQFTNNDYRGSTGLAENVSVSTRANVRKASYQGIPAPSKNISEPSEQKVFECLCKEYDCSVSFSVIAKRSDLFPNKFKDIESWFRRKKGSFRLTENDRGIILQVDAFSAKARLCFSYVSGTCKKESCSYLHVCKDYITDSCHDGATCKLNHHFHNENDKALLSRNNLDQLTDKQLSQLVLSSAPQVCVEYNHGVCDHGEGCHRIHMCSDHLKRCRREGIDCELDHESAMTSNHTQTILEHYHMEHFKSDVVKRIILVYDNSAKAKEAGHVHRNKPDAPICSDFILGNCKKGFKCPEHHCSLPFHWQYKLMADGEWKSFNEKDNEKLEKLYCDVALEEWSAIGYHISIESLGVLLLVDEVVFLFHNKRMISRRKGFDVMADIRRLSCESYASNPGNPVATVWTWYWQNEKGIWQEYDVDHLDRDMQILIEEAFLSKKTCFTFRISDQDYRLVFCSATVMHQENVRYGTRKEVRRRPAEFQSRANIQKLRRSQSANQNAGKNGTSANVPSHWSSMPSDKQYRRVPLTSASSEYKEMETLFKKTVNKNVVIKGIERVQNPFMWEKYQRKKDNMLAIKTGGHKRIIQIERRLFHGTSPETVEAICKQNFDWRLHGKNATVYGEGSYFALNSSYSDAYAKEDGNSCRFMFVAKVLVGSYTKGHSSYRRPPQKDPSSPASDLYDSCVDDKSNPNIFVVFDTDQFYPEYIIKYSHETACYPSAVSYQATHGSYQKPVAKKPVPKPRLPKTALQSGASQAHAINTAAISRSSSTPGTSVNSSKSGLPAGYSSVLNATGVSSSNTTSGSNPGSSRGSYTSSSSPSSNSGTRYQNTTGRSNPYGPSTQSGSKSGSKFGSKSGSKYKSSSKDKRKCSVM